MPSLRLKFKTTVNKWHAMVKRRIHPRDEDESSQDSQSHAESHKSKLQRIMTNAGTQLGGRTIHGIITKAGPAQGGVQAVATAAALGPPPPFITPSTAASPFSAPSQQPNSGSSHQMGVLGSSYQNPINPTETADTTDRSPQEKPHTLFSDMNGDRDQTAQIENDRLMALQMQQEIQREDWEVSALDLGLQFPVVDPNQLEKYRQRLQSVRCVNCTAPIKVDAAELVQRTRRMLKSSRKSRAARALLHARN
jgi:hypothetical protein